MQPGDKAVLNYGRWAGHEVEIVEPLELRLEMIIGNHRAERVTYRVLMPHGEIWSCLPKFLDPNSPPGGINMTSLKRGPPECSVHVPGLRVHLYGRVEAWLRRVEAGPGVKSLPEAESAFIEWLMGEPKEGDCVRHGRYVGAVCPDCAIEKSPP